ncbi:DUF397 domain-containing protein [Streptosporangium nondiastaticum]|uniref:DUF397 domain-containing protein n=1 Tax=Streptosporangium nondiastaticum TaxID=35764 RepID=A0A9X7PGG4_9ACTN|nr:DUF397 domain-containing protein [Streptosporangium nondiastaticum]
MQETASGSLTWRKSTYSGHQGDCIQIADGVTGAVPVRDSKTPDGPALVFPTRAWAAFVSHLKGAV